MSFLYLFLVGIVIGTAMIIPGVSGGVLAVIFGVYDKMIYHITNLYKDFKKSIIFLSIIGIGIIIGAILFGKIMIYLYTYYESITKYCFIGLILGSVPYLINEVNKKDNMKINYILVFSALIISFALFILSKNIFNVNLNNNLNIFNLFLSGFIYSIGKIIPGVSSSFLLIMIGMYEFVLNIIANPFDLGLSGLLNILPFIIGLIIGIIVLIKLMDYLLKNKYETTYSIIIGFVIGSLPALFPSYNGVFELVKGMIIIIVSFYLSYKLSKK